MASENNPSHKRTSSTLSNPPNPPSPKRTAISGTTSQPKQYVYIVIIDYLNAYTSNETRIIGVFSTVEDANNRLRGLVRDEFSECEKGSVTKGTEEDGRVWWKSSDIGEGDAVVMRIEKREVVGEGEEEVRDWDDDDDDDGDDGGASDGGDSDED